MSAPDDDWFAPTMPETPSNYNEQEFIDGLFPAVEQAGRRSRSRASPPRIRHPEARSGTNRHNVGPGGEDRALPITSVGSNAKRSRSKRTLFVVALCALVLGILIGALVLSKALIVVVPVVIVTAAVVGAKRGRLQARRNGQGRGQTSEKDVD